LRYFKSSIQLIGGEIATFSTPGKRGYERRDKSFNEIDKEILTFLFAETSQYRIWENPKV